jgi:putative membrane protein
MGANRGISTPAALLRYAWRFMALNLFLVWLINALALLALPYLVPSVQVDSFYTALIAALVLGFVNTLIRPLVVLLTLPATVLTLGLFIFVINGLLFWFVASFVKGFSVGGFWSAVLGAIVYALISWAASALVFGPPRVVVVRRDGDR